MSQPVKLSDSLILDARVTASASQRSIAGQVEFWASLGKAMEGLLRGREALALRRSGEARPLSECLAAVDTDAGRQRVAEYLAAQPYPHFEGAPERPGWLIKIDADGTRTLGRFVNRRFEPAPEDGAA